MSIMGPMIRAHRIAEAWIEGGAGRTQAGNYPLKLFLGSGYAALGVRPTSYPDVSETASDILNDAFNSAYDRHYRFQTGGNGRFWAEGAYYFNFAMKDVLPFWHVMRANDVQNNNELALSSEYRNISDPFNSDWFLRPLDWLAETSTPDGFTPPLDDGNKHQISTAHVLLWDGEYGRASTGEKFSRVYANLQTFHDAESEVVGSLRLIEVAMPRTTEGSSQPLSDVTNESKDNLTEQQIVIRREVEGQQHYVLLNGESGKAISRGEGHEQPDNMQLLYYVDDTSLLMDTGYDSVTVEIEAENTAPVVVGTLIGGIGGGLFGGLVGEAFGAGISDIVDWNRSTYNNYYDHNVLMGTRYHGGIPAPNLELLEGGINSEHEDIGYLYTTYHKNVVALHAKQKLNFPNELGQQGHGQYYRDVLFIGGKDPYLIDINSLDHNFDPGINYHLRMRYYGNSNSFSTNNFNGIMQGNFMSWNNIGATNGELYFQPMPLSNAMRNTATRKEMRAETRNVVEKLRDKKSIIPNPPNE